MSNGSEYRRKAKTKLNRDNHAIDEMYSSVAILTGVRTVRIPNDDLEEETEPIQKIKN